jgi:hypothetical protein
VSCSSLICTANHSLVNQNRLCVSEPFGSSTFSVYCPSHRKFVLSWRHHKDTNHLRPVCNRKAKWTEAFSPKITGLLFWSCIRVPFLHSWLPEARYPGDRQGRSLSGASGALAPGADFEGAPKRQSTTGNTLIRSTVTWWFPHLQTKRAAKDSFN